MQELIEKLKAEAGLTDDRKYLFPDTVPAPEGICKCSYPVADLFFYLFFGPDNLPLRLVNRDYS